MTGQEEGGGEAQTFRCSGERRNERNRIKEKKNRFGTKEIQADNEKMANADPEKLDTSLEAKGKTRKIL